MKRNTSQLGVSIDRHLDPADPLEGTELSPDQVRTDLEQIKHLVCEHPPDGEEQLAKMYLAVQKGTHNSCERLIGWWIKERYRSMLGL